MDQEHAQEVTTIEILVSYQLITSHLTSEEILIHVLAAEYNRQAMVLPITEYHQIQEHNNQQPELRTVRLGAVQAPGSTLMYNQDYITQHLVTLVKVPNQSIISQLSDALEIEFHLFKEIDSASITVV